MIEIVYFALNISDGDVVLLDSCWLAVSFGTHDFDWRVVQGLEFLLRGR